ncbi:MAG: hypothetical protein ABL864_15035 [Terricaulis sp.]
MLLARSLMPIALLGLAACGHVATSRSCLTYYDCGQIEGEAQQTYALPVTVVDFSFAKPAAAWTLTAAPRIVADDNPRFWYRLDYNPHPGANDHVKFEVKNGLLSSTDVQNTTQLPNVVEVLSPILRAAAGGGTGASSPSTGDRRGALLGRSPGDTFEYVPVANSVSCGIDTLVNGIDAMQTLNAGRSITNVERVCAMVVATQVRTVRVSCDDRSAGPLNEAEMRTLFGTVTDAAACSATNRVFSFKIPEMRVRMLIAPDEGNPSFWSTAYTADDCATTPAATGCFPNGTDGALYYRTTAPFQTASVPCQSRAQFSGGDAAPVSLSFEAACTPISAEDFPYLGTRHRFAAVIRRSAYALAMPRSVGGDHRIYTFSDGVLQSVDIERTGSLLGTIQLPLTILGLKD